jgi:hypothetical protein
MMKIKLGFPLGMAEASQVVDKKIEQHPASEAASPDLFLYFTRVSYLADH